MLTDHPIFWIFVAAVLAPLLAEVARAFRGPVVVVEVLLGVLIGPHVLGLVHFEGFVETMYTYGMGMTLFMAGMELDFREIKGRPLSLAALGWGASVLLALLAVGLLHVVPRAHTPMMVALALCTTGLVYVESVFSLGTPFGRLFQAAGTLGEIGPVVAMSLVMSASYSTWQEFAFLLLFLGIVGLAMVVGMSPRPPRLQALLTRHMHTSTQLPVRIALLMVVFMFMLAERFGFESVFGTFAAGLIMGQCTRGQDGKHLREKMEAVACGWFYPFFFVGTGVQFNLILLGQDLTALLMVPGFLLVFLIIRGAPVFLYRGDIAPAQRLPFAFSLAVPSLSIVAAITGIGIRTRSMHPHVATALMGGALLAIVVFPTIAGALLPRTQDAPEA